MVVNGVAAASTLLARGSCDPGLCLYYVWLAYKSHGASTGRSAAAAYLAWERSDNQHPGDRNPPPGVPVFWGPKASSSAGDVVISLGDGRVVATDWPSNGFIGVCTIAQRERQIGRPYLGWTESIFDVPVYQAPAPPAPPKPKETDMTMFYEAQSDGPTGLVTRGNRYIQDASGPLRRLEELEWSAYRFFADAGKIAMPIAPWSGADIEKLMKYVGYRHIGGRFEDGLTGRIEFPGRAAAYPVTESSNPASFTAAQIKSLAEQMAPLVKAGATAQEIANELSQRLAG